MSQVEIAEAASNLAGLVDRARGGEEVVLVEDGRVVAKLIGAEPLPRRGERVLGRLEGMFKFPDDFDAPLPDDVLDLFEGKS